MGGAVRVKGNVEQPGHDGSAEWNLFNSLEAAAHVVKAGIPLTLVPLDATNQEGISLAAAGMIARANGLFDGRAPGMPALNAFSRRPSYCASR